MNLRQLPEVVGQVGVVRGDAMMPVVGMFQVLAWFTLPVKNVGVPIVQELWSLVTMRLAVMVPVALPLTIPEVV